MGEDPYTVYVNFFDSDLQPNSTWNFFIKSKRKYIFYIPPKKAIQVWIFCAL